MGKSPRNPSDNHAVIRPGTIIITLIFMGISTLFAGLCAAYLYTVISVKVETPPPPLLFLINIPVLIVATIFIKRSLRDFDERQFRDMLMNLVICLALSLVFITLQILGWTEFFKKIPLTASQSRSFLFVLSALHLLHILAGFPFLLRFIWMNSGVLSDLRFLESERRQFLRGLIRYWNYLDILWILLVLVLSTGFVIRWL